MSAAANTSHNSLGDAPIGVFDSGLGGLTVLRVLRERFPHENFIYLGDNARIPYGSKSAQTISRYLEQNLNFLNTLNVKAIVVACNTASTSVIADMPFFKKSEHARVFKNLPIYNVIEPGAKFVAKISERGVIGVIATRATINKKSYVTEFERINPKIKVYQQACPLLVPLVEEGWDDDPITNLIVYRYLSPFLSVGIDSLVLGCTHYPLLKPAIRKVIGQNVQIVDSSEAIIEELHRDFSNGVLAVNHSGQASEVRLLSTDVSLNFHVFAQKIMSPLTLSPLEWVDLSNTNT